jgi:hypothetical protein
MADILVESQTNAHSYWAFYQAGTAYSKGAGVNHKTTSAYKLSAVEFKLGKLGSPTGNIKARVYALDAQSSSGKPTGSPLAESDAVDVASITPLYPGSVDFVKFSFGSPASLASGTHYGIVLEALGTVGDDPNKIMMAEGGPTTEGSGLTKNDAGTWATVIAGGEGQPNFKTYYNPDLEGSGNFFEIL